MEQPNNAQYDKPGVFHINSYDWDDKSSGSFGSIWSLDALKEVDEENFRLRSSRFILNYEGIIDIDDYSKTIKSRSNKSIEHIYLSIFENTHTYVAIQYFEPIDTCKKTYFNYLNIQPTIRIVKNLVQWKNALETLNIQPDIENKTSDDESTYGEVSKIRYKIKEYYPWQLNLLERLKKQPDDNIIIWIYGSKGAEGKTTLSLHLCSRQRKIYLYINLHADTSRIGDIVNRAMLNGWTEQCIFLDAPNRDDETYGTISYIKAGSVYDSSSSMIEFGSSHVVVFSNWKPDVTKLSKNRWEIYEIKNLELVNIKYEDCL